MVAWLFGGLLLWPGGAGAADALGRLTLAVRNDPATTVTQLLDPRNPAWSAAAAQPLQISRTPPLYVGDPLDDNVRPAALVRLARTAGGNVVLCAHWSDPTDNRTSVSAPRVDAGQAQIYHAPTERTSAFADAFCLMAPVKRGPSAQYPTMMMGEPKQPVELYYWRAGEGFRLLAGHGRGTTGPPINRGQSTGDSPLGQALREGDGWTLTMALPSLAPGTPVCFAIWDGAKEQRDGLKYFSLWYEVE